MLYVTEPNIPAEFQKGIVNWVKAGGTVVTVSGAGAYDRYNDPCDVMANGLGIADLPRERLIIQNLGTVKNVGQGETSPQKAAFTAWGALGQIDMQKSMHTTMMVLASVADRPLAYVMTKAGRGKVYHFDFLPGLSYVKSQTGATDGLPSGFSETIRGMITLPAGECGRRPAGHGGQIDDRNTDAPLQRRGSGDAPQLDRHRPNSKSPCASACPSPQKTVSGVKAGKVDFTQVKDLLTCTVPLDKADVLSIKP